MSKTATHMLRVAPQPGFISLPIFRALSRTSRSSRQRANQEWHQARNCASDSQHKFSLAEEIKQATREGRRFRFDKSLLTEAEKHMLRLRSKSIPLVADSEPLEILFEDDTFLVVNKPPFLKMHPSHRFEGGSVLNRAIGYLGYPPRLLHRLDMVR